MHLLGVESTISTMVKRYKFAIKCGKDYFDINIYIYIYIVKNNYTVMTKNWTMRADTTHLTNETSNDNLYLPNSQVSRQGIDILWKRERERFTPSTSIHMPYC